MRRVLVVAAVAAGLALAVAGTGIAAGGPATVKTHHGSLGTFLVGTNGRTLYLFEKDKTKKSTCSGSCATAWPPLLTTGHPKAAGSAKASLLGTTKRSDGTTQVTYKGHPVYYFVKDKKPGDAKGEGINAFGAEWYVMSPSGTKIEPKGGS
jgi:predicted lipoprotein with Yx(FWY)xxD motif